MNRRSRIYAAMAAAILLTCTIGARADKGNNGEVRLKTKLTGAAMAGAAMDSKTPEGSADFRLDDKGRMRLNVEVEHVNLPKGTVLMVTVMHGAVSTAAGSITLSGGGSGELDLESQDGAMVPAVQSGDVITVSNGVQAILAGVF